MKIKILLKDTLETNIKLQGFPKKYVKYILANALFYHDGNNVALHDCLNIDDLVDIDENETTSIKEQTLPLKIVYEDEYLLVIDKPFNQAMSPTHAHPDGTVANAIVAHYQRIGIKQTVHYITRLDHGTAGIVLIAKTKWSKHLMQLQRYDIKRLYYAQIQGMLLHDGYVEQPIAKGHGIMRCIDTSGQYALTYYEVCNHIDDTTVVRCQLKTGRTHQIRVHLAYLGYPIVNDTLYNQTKANGFMKLICYQNSFIHPVSQKLMTFESEHNLL